MKRLLSVVIMALALLASGCAGVLPRVAAYSVVPTKAGDFAEYEDYTVVTFPTPPILARTERGMAWEIIVRFPDGNVERYLSTAMMVVGDDDKIIPLMGEENVGKLTAIVPQSIAALKDAAVMVQSHDRKRCASLDGKDLGWCASVRWDRASAISAYTSAVQRGSAEDARWRSAYRAAMSHELVRKENFGLSAAELERIKAADATWYEVGEVGGSSLAVFGVGWIFGGPIGGAVAGGVVLAARAASLAIRYKTKQDVNHPEYLSGSLNRLDKLLLEQQISQTRALIQDVQRAATDGAASVTAQAVP